MTQKEQQLYASTGKNKVDEVNLLLAQKDSFDLNWKNPKHVSI